METETLTDYNKTGDQVDLSNDLKKNVNHESVSNHVEKSNGNKADLDDSRSDEEEYIPLLLEGSKSDEDDDLDELDSVQNNDGSQKTDDKKPDECLTDSKPNEKELAQHDSELPVEENLDSARENNGIIATSNENPSGQENTEETNVELNRNINSEEDMNNLHKDQDVGRDKETDDVAPDNKSNEATGKDKENDDSITEATSNEAAEKKGAEDDSSTEAKSNEVVDKEEITADCDTEAKSNEATEEEEAKDNSETNSKSNETSEKDERNSNSHQDTDEGELKEDNIAKDVTESSEKEHLEEDANKAVENEETSVDSQNIDDNEKTDSNSLEEDEKSPSKSIEKKHSEEEYNMDMYEDFDPSLLCPDIAMEVDEAPVITNNSAPPPTDGDKSPSLYDPIFSTIVDEFTGTDATIILTPEEERTRQETYGAGNPVELTKIHCTACNVHLGSALNGQGNRFVHPLLKVLICKNCYHFYTSGEFERDEDGSELYCRWCGQGGQVMCCSNCEMVFCKKCIRINFDRKTIAQIRDSEDWVCFRCNPSQITHLKIHCAEFMEYVRRETSRAATLENAADFMKVDHCRCCLPQKKKASETVCDVPKKRKRKASHDPNYNPYADRDSPQPTTSDEKNPKEWKRNDKAEAEGGRSNQELLRIREQTAKRVKAFRERQRAGIQANSSIPLVPKTADQPKNAGPPTVLNNNAPLIQIFKLKPGGSGLYGPKPKVHVIGSGPPPRAPTAASPGYVKILPTGKRPPANEATPRPKPNARQPEPQNKQTKHEWFEKTVIAAARVNSNLSYTLTQLNRQQANAVSVESLAVIHNKLQEILSTSINNLIKIRKKLRMDFIEGIKNIRFPAPNKSTAKQPPPRSSADQDDDVIIVSPSTSPVPPSIRIVQKPPAKPANSQLKVLETSPVLSSPPPLTPLLQKGGVMLTGKNKDSVRNVGNVQQKGFLRVKSMTALLNVTSECITIPDDPVQQQTTKPDIEGGGGEGGGEDKLKPATKDSSPTMSAAVVNSADVIVDDDDDDDDVKIIEKPIVEVDLTEPEFSDQKTYDLNVDPSKDLKKIMNVHVLLERSAVVEKLIQLYLRETENNVTE